MQSEERIISSSGTSSSSFDEYTSLMDGHVAAGSGPGASLQQATKRTRKSQSQTQPPGSKVASSIEVSVVQDFNSFSYY